MTNLLSGTEKETVFVDTSYYFCVNIVSDIVVFKMNRLKENLRIYILNSFNTNNDYIINIHNICYKRGTVLVARTVDRKAILPGT